MCRDKRYMALTLLAVFLFVASLVNSHLTAGGAPETGAGAPGPGKVHAFPGFPVDVNSASFEELTLLPGVGAKTAKRIIGKRIEAGGFSSVDEFAMSARLGKSRIEKIRPLIALGGERG